MHIDLGMEDGQLVKIGVESGTASKHQHQVQAVRSVADMPDQPFQGGEKELFRLVDHKHGLHAGRSALGQQLLQRLEKMRLFVRPSGVHAQIQTDKAQQFIKRANGIVEHDYLVSGRQTLGDQPANQRFPRTLRANQFDQLLAGQDIENHRLADLFPFCSRKKNFRIRLFHKRRVGQVKMFEIHALRTRLVKDGLFRQQAGNGNKSFDYQ
jgi:hypothetical protein